MERPSPFRQERGGKLSRCSSPARVRWTRRCDTGVAPATSTPLEGLPKPKLDVKVTIGGVPAKVDFAGIPYGLVGVTQVNFVVPADAPLGKQPVVVTVGNTASAPAQFTVTP